MLWLSPDNGKNLSLRESFGVIFSLRFLDIALWRSPKDPLRATHHRMYQSTMRIDSTMNFHAESWNHCGITLKLTDKALLAQIRTLLFRSRYFPNSPLKLV
jgi:hypothetical protein